MTTTLGMGAARAVDAAKQGEVAHALDLHVVRSAASVALLEERAH